MTTTAVTKWQNARFDRILMEPFTLQVVLSFRECAGENQRDSESPAKSPAPLKVRRGHVAGYTPGAPTVAISVAAHPFEPGQRLMWRPGRVPMRGPAASPAGDAGDEA